MRILNFSSDRKLFESNSPVQKRMEEYGSLFDALHIIVLAAKKEGFRPLQLGEKVFVYPVNYVNKALSFCREFYLGKAIIKKEKISAITCQDPFEAGLIGWFLSRVCKLPFQLQIHTDVFSLYFGRESLKNKIRIFIAKVLLPRANGIRVVSERIRQSIIEKYPKLKEKIAVLPIYVNIKKIQSEKIKIDLHQKYLGYSPIILMASRLTKEKNISLAMEAMVSVVKKNSTALLLITGDGSELNELKAKSAKLKIADNVKFESWTNDLISYYKTADFFLLTSDYEGYGRTVIEAMAAGLSVIMTDVGLAGEILIDDLDGKIVSVGDRKALAEAITELWLNKRKLAVFRGNALKLLEQFQSKKDYLEKYKNLLLF